MKTIEDILKNASAGEIDLEEPRGFHKQRFYFKARRLNAPKAVAWTSFAIAAICALVLVLPIGKSGFGGMKSGKAQIELVGRNSDAVYANYQKRVSKEYDYMLANGGAGTDWNDTFENIIWESIPLTELIPEELPESERTELVRKHYSQLITQLSSLRKEFRNIK